jgi:hypothetical protein
MTDLTTPMASNDVDRVYPPIAWMTTGALCFIIVGGIVMASYAPHVAPLAVSWTLMALGVALVVSAYVALSRIKVFSWTTFRNVLKWALLAYAIEAGVIEFAFIHLHTRGRPLLIVSVMLLVFATSVPTTIAFTVARYAQPD